MDLLYLLSSSAGGVAACVFGFLSFLRTHRLDDGALGKRDGTVLTELGYIKSGVDDIKKRQEKQDARYLELATRIAALEAQSANAECRIQKAEYGQLRRIPRR